MIDNAILGVILGLTQKTITGEVKWRITNAPSTLVGGTDYVVPIYLAATYKTQNYSTFVKRIRHFDGEHGSFYWVEYGCFAVLYNEVILYEYMEESHSGPVNDLLENARKQQIDFKTLIKDF